jgi:murein DD-endopeptidase MepM/ murein hydrolase activator NlpD
LQPPTAKSSNYFKANAAVSPSINSTRTRTEGAVVRQGEVIAYVGDTGNAGPGNYHLHFSIAAVSDPKRYWEGANINPYPLLQNRPR